MAASMKRELEHDAGEKATKEESDDEWIGPTPEEAAKPKKKRRKLIAFLKKYSFGPIQ